MEKPGHNTYSPTYRPAGGSPLLAHPMEPPMGSATLPPGFQILDAVEPQPRRGLFRRKRQ